MNKHVLYFSPTGGTEKVAQMIADEVKGNAVDITIFNYDMSFGDDDLVFFCVPVYGGRIPAPMYRRMEDIRGSKTPAVMVAVYGNRAVDDALMEMSDVATKSGFWTVGGCEMIVPHSLATNYGADRPDASDRVKLRAFLDKLLAKEHFTTVAMPGSHDYRKFSSLPIYPTSGKNCNGCGTCAQECPTGAINPAKPQKPDTSKCITCMRCVYMCPFEARKAPAAGMLAVRAALAKKCAGRKEPAFYL